MDTNETFAHIKRLTQYLKSIESSESHRFKVYGAKLQVVEFLKAAAGSKSSFLTAANDAVGSPEYLAGILTAVLESFQSHVQAGLQDSLGPERKAQIDVVSDFLEQAYTLLNSNGVHPAGPIVITGASLEEFLRTWVEDRALPLNDRKPSLEVYAHVLAGADLITKQDVKDITAWAGLRNHAAHGQWGEVGDKQRASIMLEAVNLFIRKYGG
jgi:hypothetical protein